MLNPKLKSEAFRLRNEEHMTYHEIGRQLNIPCSTVKSWFSRASALERNDCCEERDTERYAQKNQAVSHPITAENQQRLSANPYVRFVSENQIRFTQSFREEYWRRYQNGQEPGDILNALGIDPEALGEARRTGLHKRISEAAAIGCLSVGAESDTSRLLESMAIPAKVIEQMRHELMYLRQEVTFMKKSYRRARRKGHDADTGETGAKV